MTLTRYTNFTRASLIGKERKARKSQSQLPTFGGMLVCRTAVKKEVGIKRPVKASGRHLGEESEKAQSSLNDHWNTVGRTLKLGRLGERVPERQGVIKVDVQTYQAQSRVIGEEYHLN